MLLPKPITKIISTFFYAGFFPFAPGTFASLIGAIIFYFVKDEPGICLYVALFLAALGFIVSGKAEEVFGVKDPKFVVIDEVSGMFLSFLFMPYFNLKVWTIGFLMFRIFDTFKPFPAGRIQHLKGSLGIMCDDLIAAIYTNIILQIIFRFASFRTS